MFAVLAGNGRTSMLQMCRRFGYVPTYYKTCKQMSKLVRAFACVNTSAVAAAAEVAAVFLASTPTREVVMICNFRNNTVCATDRPLSERKPIL